MYFNLILVGGRSPLHQSGVFFVVRAKANINSLLVAKYNEMGFELSHNEMKLTE
ncbi:hypothetical protein [Thorsellia kenyensis]|uniref:Uncharacterized protein n=1 Tax=Thorsellia kenyensis TaxID=1549888 RepID=A0ABV6CCH3_9GAMM